MKANFYGDPALKNLLLSIDDFDRISDIIKEIKQLEYIDDFDVIELSNQEVKSLFNKLKEAYVSNLQIAEVKNDIDNPAFVINKSNGHWIVKQINPIDSFQLNEIYFRLAFYGAIYYATN
jgi:hypothetical protein